MSWHYKIIKWQKKVDVPVKTMNLLTYCLIQPFNSAPCYRVCRHSPRHVKTRLYKVIGTQPFPLLCLSRTMGSRCGQPLRAGGSLKREVCQRSSGLMEHLNQEDFNLNCHTLSWHCQRHAIMGVTQQWTHSPNPCVLKQKTSQQKNYLTQTRVPKPLHIFLNCVLVFRQGYWNNLDLWTSMFWHKWLPVLHHTAIIHISNALDHFFMQHESDIHIFHFYKHNNVWLGWYLKCAPDDSNVEFSSFLEASRSF